MIYDHADLIAARIVSAGIRATTDPARVDPPCALVMVEEATFQVMCPGEGTTRWVIHCIAPPSGRGAFHQIGAMVAAIIPVVPEVREARVTSYRTGAGDPWPCIDLHWETQSSWV
jgi:hypothetical protein